MPLFHVQDSDRPGWVIARSYGEAVEKWRAAVGRENEGCDVDLPAGVEHVCDDNDLIVDREWLEPLGGAAPADGERA